MEIVATERGFEHYLHDSLELLKKMVQEESALCFEYTLNCLTKLTLPSLPVHFTYR